MELIWLQDFVTLTADGIFSKAAQRRNVTQPAFTRRIRKLEYALGVQLFDRSVHPVVLTEAGTSFLPVAKNIILEWERSRADFSRNTEGNGRIRIACLQSLGVSFVPHLVRRSYPTGHHPAIQVMPENFAGCIEALMTGSADVMVCYTNDTVPIEELYGDFTAIELDRDVLLPVARATNGKPMFCINDHEVPFLAYGPNSFLGRLTRSILEGPGTHLDLKVVYEDPIGSALKTAVLIGMGIAWLPHKLVADEMAEGLMTDLSSQNPSLSAQIRITAYRNERTNSANLDRFWKKIAADGKIISAL